MTLISAEHPETASAAGAPATDEQTAAEATAPEPVHFEEFGLPEPLMKAIADLGFSQCTDIQAETLPHSLSDYDVTGQAQTGTGKTAAFLITIIAHQLEYPLPEPPPVGTPRALIIAPTRELAMQIAEDARDLTRHAPHVNVLTVVGGMDFEKQREVLEQEIVDILVATPGRLIDFVTRGKVNLRQVDQLVLDEADRMLSMGFIPDVRRIIRQTPPKRHRQTLLFSATFNEEVLRLAEQWTLEPEHVVIEPESVATDNVDQRVFLVSAREKFPLLYNLMNDLELTRVIVFANRRDTTRRIQERLAALGVECELLSGEVPQAKRLKTLERFKDGSTRVLAATDVAGRGLHVDAISHVINYDLPEDPEDYVHRIGRTGRAGAKGISISFVGETDAFLMPEIEALLGQSLPCKTPAEELLEAPDEPARPKSDRGERRGGRSGPPRRRS
ncbi:MAG: DEAD/DEAH box helicase [Gammaproteobacteria bacterium]|nr:DEAD/DEAH box helicase [Gammaproteobacteria bacterium]